MPKMAVHEKNPTLKPVKSSRSSNSFEIRFNVI